MILLSSVAMESSSSKPASAELACETIKYLVKQNGGEKAKQYEATKSEAILILERSYLSVTSVKRIFGKSSEFSQHESNL